MEGLMATDQEVDYNKLDNHTLWKEFISTFTEAVLKEGDEFEASKNALSKMERVIRVRMDLGVQSI
jgi:hypothetical protein